MIRTSWFSSLQRPRAASRLLALAAVIGAFAAGRATAEPDAKTAHGGWARVTSASAWIRSVAATLSRTATSPETVGLMQAIEAAPAADRPALAANAVDKLGTAAPGPSSVPLAFRITFTGTKGVEVLAETPGAPEKKVEHWGDPHENVHLTLQAGALTLSIRAPFPPTPAPEKPSKPK